MDDVEYASMTEARKKHLAGLHEEGKRLGKECLTISEIEEVIRETALSPTDRRIATMRYVRCLTAPEIAGALNTASINATTTAQTQKILDAISANKIEALQGKVSELQLAQAMQGVVRYPSSWAYNAGPSPFCPGCGF